MLAPNKIVSMDDLQYPVLASEKLDGIRALCLGDKIVSRTGKPFRNKYLHEYFATLKEYSIKHRVVLDMELFDDNFTHLGNIVSIVNSFTKDLPPTFEPYIFDVIPFSEWENEQAGEFRNRINNPCLDYFPSKYNFLPHYQFTNAHDLNTFYQRVLRQHEGIIVRSPYGGYKHGRCTLGDNIMYKLKEFETIDGIIVEIFHENMLVPHLEREKDEIGYLKKTYKKENKIAVDVAGSVKVKLEDGRQCKVTFGRGFTKNDKKAIWKERESYLGKHVEIEYQKFGNKDNLRTGKIVRFRDAK